MSKIIYHLLIKPLSSLPFSVLFVIADILSFLLYYIIGFRKKVVFDNLTRSFPAYSSQEIKAIAKQFYQHFSDLILESVKLFNISEAEVIRRCKVVNPELLDQYHEQGRNVALIGGHYGNWELLATALNRQIKTQAIAIYKPLKNKTFNNAMKSTRSKLGLELVPKREVREAIATAQNRSHAIIFGNDQCPSSHQKVYWVDFLNQPTAVMIGIEGYIEKYNYVVVMAKIKKIKRGFYTITFELITEQPKALAVGTLTKLHTKVLEEQILEAPAYWLWTHRRWKRSRKDYSKNIN